MLRYRFNTYRVIERAQRGAIPPPSVIDEGPAPLQAHEPPGTFSQFILYRIGGQDYAKCHRYLRPDGSLGGSGLPDPKWLRVGGETWMVAHEDSDPPCPDCPSARAENEQWLRENT